MNVVSGGASTHFQVLSSESRKYFHNAIALSGTAFTPWALSDEKNHIALANSIAEDLGKPTNSLDALTHFLTTTPGKTLAPSVFLTASAKTHKFKFAPVIESVQLLICLYLIHSSYPLFHYEFRKRRQKPIHGCNAA